MREEAQRLLGWLADEALPLWSTTGVDRERGGFFERIEPNGTVVGDVRRARLVARHIYVFRMAGELGWNGPSRDLVEHGLSALLRHHVDAQERIIPRHHPASGESEGAFDLYDQAFGLFGLAHGFGATRDGRLESLALAILERMRAGWQHPAGGFDEREPEPAMLKANPHMHLLEAALAWIEVADRPEWRRLAAEVTELCLTRFIAPATGALHEYFDGNWQRLTDEGIDVVEPGHQAEWAWLLMRWARLSGDGRIAPVARRLFDIAEGEGLDATGSRLVNELDATLRPRWTWQRLWPQTERIKALVLFAGVAENEADRATLERCAAAAADSLTAYFDHPIRGAWWEHLDESRQPVAEPARASSLYHIMGAAVELARATGSTISEGQAPAPYGRSADSTHLAD